MADKKTLRIGHLRISDHLVLGMTKAKLIKGAETFDHAEIETVAMTGWNSIGEALIAGEIDIAFMLAPYAMELFHSGEKLKLILFAHKDGSIIVSNKRAAIEKVEDFKGKTILIPYHQSVHHMLIDKLLTDHGLETGVGKDVSFEVVAPSQIPQMIEWDEDGDIGGYIVAEPFGSQVIASGMGQQMALSKEIWPDHPCCVVVVREEIAERHPEAVQELTESLVKSGQLIHDKPETAIKVGASFLNQDIAVMQAVLDVENRRVSTNQLLPQLDDLERMQSYLTSKVSAMSGKIDLEKFVDLRFAQGAGAR